MPDPARLCDYCKNPAEPGKRMCRVCAYDVSHPDEGPKESGGQKPAAEEPPEWGDGGTD